MFVSPTCDLDAWAKVPTRMSSRPRGFQRAALGPHVKELESFFDHDSSKTNSSPTTILIGLDPRFKDAIRIFSLDGKSLDLDLVSIVPQVVEVHISFTEWDGSQYGDDIASELDALVEQMEQEGFFSDATATVLEAAPRENAAPLTTTAAVEADGSADDDVDADEDEYVIDADGDDEDEDDEPSAELAAEGAGVASESSAQRLEEMPLPADLRLADLNSLRAAWRNRRITVDDARIKTLREILIDERKPGLIIDGQHRVAATKRMGEIPFGVCLIPDAEWAELAFQFIVNNHTAKKVDENLLTAIVGQSLSDAELASIETRLKRAGIKVQLIRASTRIQVEDNPFMGMLRTSTVGEKGFLESKAMQKHVIGLWYGKRAKASDRAGMATFRLSNNVTLAMRKHSMAKLFLANCEGKNKQQRMQDWQRDKWLKYFSAFWAAVRTSYQPAAVWPQTEADWPDPSLGKQKPNQEKVVRLMRTTLLGLLQLSVLQRWADMRYDSLGLDERRVKKTPITPEEFQAEIATILRRLTPDFFTSLKASGFEGSATVKEDTKLMIYDICKGARTVAEEKALPQYSKYFE
jgi:hypothetical protein